MLALRGASADPSDRAWVRSVLTAAELDLWNRQSSFDRAHSVRVARRVQRRLAPTEYRDDSLWLAAALMHDVGKLQSGLSMGERMIATLASKAVDVSTARRWASSATGAKRRIGSYLIHGEIGASMIRAAGGREGIVAWARAHQGYRSETGSCIPPAVLEALIESDVG